MRASPVLLKAVRRLPLTTKQAGKDFYKGTGTGAMGRHTNKGGYVVMYEKVRTYVMPDLSDFELTPFVDRNIEAKRDTAATYGDTDPKMLIKRWKEAGGRS